MVYFLITVFVIYVIYTLSFAIKLNKANTIFNGNQKLIHNILIWIIPFFWIMVIKTIMKPTPGSEKFKKTKPNASFYESGIGIWGNDSSSHHTDSGHGNSSDH